MKLHAKPSGVTMTSVYDDIWRIELELYGQGHYHAGSQHTDPLFTETGRNEILYRRTACPSCRRMYVLQVTDTHAEFTYACKCGKVIYPSLFDCNACGAKAGRCKHVTAGYIKGDWRDKK